MFSFVLLMCKDTHSDRSSPRPPALEPEDVPVEEGSESQAQLQPVISSTLGLANNPDEYVLTPRTAQKYAAINMQYRNIIAAQLPQATPQTPVSVNTPQSGFPQVCSRSSLCLLS